MRQSNYLAELQARRAASRMGAELGHGWQKKHVKWRVGVCGYTPNRKNRKQKRGTVGYKTFAAKYNRERVNRKERPDFRPAPAPGGVNPLAFMALLLLVALVVFAALIFWGLL